MALKKRKPTSPGMRDRVDLVKNHTTKKPHKKLLKSNKGPKGRSKGKISVRHQARGAKKHYRIIDFKRNKFGIRGKVATIEYDPNRNADIALIIYEDGEKRYIIAPDKLRVGDKVIADKKAEPKAGNAMKLKNIPLGTPIHNIEINPGAGGQIARGAGTKCFITAKEGKYVNIKLPSGEVKKVLGECLATVGSVSNPDYKNIKLGKVGRKRHMGIRPTVRGVAQSNLSSHPHAGSYTSSGVGRKSPVSPTGVKAKGKKTRRRKKTDVYKVKDRRDK